MGLSNTPSKTTALALNQKAIKGVDKYLSHTKQLVVGGKTYTPASLKAVLQAEIDRDNAVDESRAQLRQQVVAAGLARANARAIRKWLKTYLLSNFGPDAVQTVEDFGMTVPKTPKRSAKSKAAAVDKAAVTRAAHEGQGSTQVAPAPSAPPAATVTASAPKS